MNALIFKFIMYVVGANKLPKPEPAEMNSIDVDQIKANVTAAVTRNVYSQFNDRLEAIVKCQSRIRAKLKILKEQKEQQERQARIQMKLDRMIYLKHLN